MIKRALGLTLACEQLKIVSRMKSIMARKESFSTAWRKWPQVLTCTSPVKLSCNALMSSPKLSPWLSTTSVASEYAWLGTTTLVKLSYYVGKGLCQHLNSWNFLSMHFGNLTNYKRNVMPRYIRIWLLNFQDADRCTEFQQTVFHFYSLAAPLPCIIAYIIVQNHIPLLQKANLYCQIWTVCHLHTSSSAFKSHPFVEWRLMMILL